jgi:hypothetical protein
MLNAYAEAGGNVVDTAINYRNAVLFIALLE